MPSQVIPKMQQAIVRDKESVKTETIAVTDIMSDEVLAMPLISGLCGTDIQMLKNERSDPAAIIGHEGIVKLIKVGADCPSDLKEGDKYIINPTHPTNPDYLLGHTIPGLFQQYLKIPAAMIKANLLMPVNNDFPIMLSPLIEPLAAVIYAFELIEFNHENPTLAIYGDGIIGHLALWWLKKHYPGISIIMLHHNQQGLDWSLQQVIQADKNTIFNRSATNEMPAFNAALIATPKIATVSCLEHAVECISEHGYINIFASAETQSYPSNLPTLDIAKLRASNCGGIPENPVRKKVTSIEKKSLTVCGQRGVANRNLQQACQELTNAFDYYQPLITHKLDLLQAANFMQQLKDTGKRTINGDRVIKLAIDCHSINER